MKNKLLRPVCSMLAAILTMSVGILPGHAADNASESITLPYSATDSKAQTYEYLYLVGGYHAPDNGCPAWGTSDPKSSRLIGDEMGHVSVTYTDGTTAEIPLVFGYTLWFHAPWQEVSAPFKNSRNDRELTALLKDTLSLKGAFEGDAACVLRVSLAGKPVRSVTLVDNPDKEGAPVISGAVLASGASGSLKAGGVTFNAGDAFFNTHTVDASDPMPASVTEALSVINHALMTYEEDYASAPVFEFPADYTGGRVVFSGSPLANIATGSLYHNVKSILDRVDREGMLHTSYRNAPSWRYDGFGYWVEKAGSYYTSYYSRDGGRALMTLDAFGYADTAARSLLYANKQMMYFPENHMTMSGVDVPGHFTVVVNQPLLYSTVLVPQAGWATRYTQSAFGKDYQNLGNQETDGHGLMMMANYITWKNLGAKAELVESDWTAIREAAVWIAWCFEHPELSFVKDGLLYAESEAGMMKYTMYCNFPCMLGLYGYAEMAETAGHTEEAEAWRTMADALRDAISSKFIRPKTGTWNSTGFGFFHDPALTMLADVYGYDPEGWPEIFADWVTASRRSYASDLTSVSEYSWYGAGGIGYHHSMITQNALLTDHMADATKLVENLCRISYSPRLPDPYIIPEGVTYDASLQALRRQGDLGNLVQAAEAMKCLHMVTGIDGVRNGTLSVTPRLPEGWDVNVSDFDVQYSDARVNMSVTYPSEGMQTASLSLAHAEDVQTVSFRMGPLPADTKYAAVSVNGVNVPCRFSLSGDSAWVYVFFTPSAEGKDELILLYAKTPNELGTFPAADGESAPSDPETVPEVTAEESVTETAPLPAPSGCVSLLSSGTLLLAAAAAGIGAVLLMDGGKKKKLRVPAAVGLCAALCVIPLLTACAVKGDVPADTEADETHPVTQAATEDSETQPETVDPRIPTIIATAPAWETFPEDAEEPRVDPTALIDLVKGRGGVKITASTTENGRPDGPLGPKSCFDGDLNTRWSSDQHDVEGCWLRVDFDELMQIGGVYVNEVKIWGKVSAWEAQYYSESAGDWVTVLEDYSFKDGVFYGFSELTEPTHSFRLRFFESSSLAVSLWEVNVMGTPFEANGD